MFIVSDPYEHQMTFFATIQEINEIIVIISLLLVLVANFMSVALDSIALSG